MTFNKNNSINIILLLCFLVIATAATKHDFNLLVRDFGSRGTPEYVKFILSNSMQPGTLISVLSRTYDRGIIDIIDAKWNDLIHISATTSTGNNKFYISSKMNNKWLNGRITLKKNPIKQGALTVTTIAYEEHGYRIYVNNNEEAFYEHRTSNPPWAVCAFKNTIYKIIYFTGTPFEGGVRKYLRDIADYLI